MHKYIGTQFFFPVTIYLQNLYCVDFKSQRFEWYSSRFPKGSPQKSQYYIMQWEKIMQTPVIKNPHLVTRKKTAFCIYIGYKYICIYIHGTHAFHRNPSKASEPKNIGTKRSPEPKKTHNQKKTKPKKEWNRKQYWNKKTFLRKNMENQKKIEFHKI